MFFSSKATTPVTRTRRLSMAVAAGALLGVTALSGCSVANSSGAAGSSGAGAPAAGDTLRVVLQQEPPTLEACESNLTSTGVVVRSTITEPLIERNPTSGELEPKLATEWTSTDDTIWTLKLREGVKFHDGSEFTAEDAAATIDRAVNGKLGCNVEGYVFGDDDLSVFEDGGDDEDDAAHGARKLVNPSAATRDKFTSVIHLQLSENQGEVRFSHSEYISINDTLSKFFREKRALWHTVLM